MKHCLTLLTALLLCACTAREPLYKDPAAPVSKRVEDLLGRMTLEEKLGQMNQYTGLEHIRKTERRVNAGRDLSKRIDLGPGNDELHQLAGNFNSMMDRLEKSFHAEKQFTSDVSHELRTPISVIRAECEYILEQDRDKEEYIEAIKDNTLNYYEYEVLEFARIDEEWFNVKVRILGKVYGSGKSWQTVPMKFRFVQDGIDNIRLAYIGVDLGV